MTKKWKNYLNIIIKSNENIKDDKNLRKSQKRDI